MALIPKGCHVRNITLDGRGKAEVRFGCASSNQYESRHVKAREVNFRGSYVSGAARVDFVLSPASAVCNKSGSRITCKLVGDTAQDSLRGSRRRRKR